MRRLTLSAAILFFALTVNAQTRTRPAARPTPKPAPARTLRETVKTQDGREIRLYDDMTYEVAPASQVAPTANVDIKAGVITNGGDVKPVARRTFIVFKGDIKPIIATVNDREGKPLDVFSFYMADEYAMLDSGRTYAAALEKLKPIIVGTFTTDFNGNASVQLPSGDAEYYIYGSFKVGRSACMWYLKFNPQGGGVVTLDNNNAKFCG